MRFNRLAGEKEFPNLRQACRCALVVTIAADAHPHRVFVQLDVLLLCSANTIPPRRPLPMGSASAIRRRAGGTKAWGPRSPALQACMAESAPGQATAATAPNPRARKSRRVGGRLALDFMMSILGGSFFIFPACRWSQTKRPPPATKVRCAPATFAD